jgi:hypothetical protein
LERKAQVGASGEERTREDGKMVVLLPDVGIEGEKPRLAEKVWVVATSEPRVG